MKKIIALRGRSQVGKTTTLNILIGMLDTSLKTEELKRDRRISLIYRGIKIAICTAGDSKDIIKSNIAFIQENDCEVLITATRTRGAGVNTLKEYVTLQNVPIKWVNKTIVEREQGLSDEEYKIEWKDANFTQARDLKKLIDNFIDTL